MDDYVDETMLEFERFAIGQPVPRSEDPVMVRSGRAHGVIRNVDTKAARAMPGVLGVYTAEDLEAAGIGPLPPRQVMNNRDGTPMRSPIRYALAKDKVQYVGDPIAAVIAETAAA